MKALIFLIVIVAAVSVLVWRTRKAQAEEARARRKAIERRKAQQRENLAQDIEMIWPVIIRPAKGDQESDAQADEPSMTTIEYEPPKKATP